MGSIYKPKDKKHWYISFIDPDTGKPKNRSTGLLATPGNHKLAEEILQEVEDVITERKNLYKNYNIKRATIEEAFESFLRLNSDKNIKTIGDYERFINLFSKSFDLDSPCTILTKLSAEEWIIKIKTLNRSKNTIYNYFKVFNKFLNFLFEYDYIPVFKLNKNLKPKTEIKEIIVFKKEDLELILNELKTKNNNFRTVISLMIYSGLRPSDVYKIKVEDIDLDELSMTYYSQKLSKWCKAYLHNDLKEIILERINEVKSGLLFEYTDYKNIGKAFRRYLEELNLNEKGYNLRTFRKHFATAAWEYDVNVTSTSRLLNHQNISTTIKYYTNASQKKLTEDINKIKFISKKGE
jgi:integrase